MISKFELARWLETLPDGAMVGVDDGGLTLVALADDGDEIDDPPLFGGGRVWG